MEFIGDCMPQIRRQIKGLAHILIRKPKLRVAATPLSPQLRLSVINNKIRKLRQKPFRISRPVDHAVGTRAARDDELKTQSRLSFGKRLCRNSKWRPD